MAVYARTARLRAFQVPLTLLCFFACAGMALGQTPTIVRVEEDWELVVGTPDPGTDAPQVTCVISPYGNLDSWYATFELNQQNELTFEAGGLQLQVWDDEVLVVDKGYPNRNILSQPDEVIRWTQSLQLHDDTLIFEITDGSSTTWSSFGGQGYLKTAIDTSLTNLDSYSPSVSVGNSGVSYAGNRVQSLTLRAVRYYTSTGQVIEDNIPKAVNLPD